MERHQPRLIRTHGLHERDGWRLKLYSISFDGSDIAWPSFVSGVSQALETLPGPAEAAGRPGLGFLIAHHGQRADYVVLCWWDQENELPTRVFVSKREEEGWRPAAGGESFCVWDLEVMAFERDAYVATVLGNESDGPSAYLIRRAGVPADTASFPA